VRKLENVSADTDTPPAHGTSETDDPTSPIAFTFRREGDNVISLIIGRLATQQQELTRLRVQTSQYDDELGGMKLRGLPYISKTCTSDHANPVGINPSTLLTTNHPNTYLQLTLPLSTYTTKSGTIGHLEAGIGVGIVARFKVHVKDIETPSHLYIVVEDNWGACIRSL
jgi:hypothetical protein